MNQLTPEEREVGKEQFLRGDGRVRSVAGGGAVEAARLSEDGDRRRRDGWA